MSESVIRICVRLITALLFCCGAAKAWAAEPVIERWGVFQVALHGPDSGNPFTDVTLSATFSHGDTHTDVAGFYDGGGTYRVRFMPRELGTWSYQTHSNRPELDGKTGAFTCGPAAAGNHGPVAVRNVYHFGYADGTPYFPIGTTCYAWIHQPDALQEQTLATLKASPFNKLRMCVFPKWYAHNHSEPIVYPFAGTPPNKWDFTRFNPEFFRRLEMRVGQLRDLGIEADLILFHPYDKGHWGFDRMPASADDRYVRYVVARVSAYRNVWWSMANEWDFMKEKKESDFDRLFQIVQSSDPYGHLRSIHNGALIYDHNKPWVTHASIQNGSAVADFGRAVLYRDVYRKPVVFDEVKYEGNIDQRWGNLSAEEMVFRFWQGAIAGTYVGHGETYRDPNDILWWSKGGVLHGQSPARIAFLREVLEDGPKEGLEPIDKWQDDYVAGKAGEYYLLYLGKAAPTQWSFELPRGGLKDGMTFRAEILDTWNMTVSPVDGTFTVKAISPYRYSAGRSIALPGKPYLALRIRRAG